MTAAKYNIKTVGGIQSIFIMGDTSGILRGLRQGSNEPWCLEHLSAVSMLKYAKVYVGTVSSLQECSSAQYSWAPLPT